MVWAGVYHEAFMLFLRKSFSSLLTPTVAPKTPRETFTGSAAVPFWVLILLMIRQKGCREMRATRIPVSDRIDINTVSDQDFFGHFELVVEYVLPVRLLSMDYRGEMILELGIQPDSAWPRTSSKFRTGVHL